MICMLLMALFLGALAVASTTPVQSSNRLVAVLGGIITVVAGSVIQIVLGMTSGCWLDEHQPILLDQLTRAPEAAAMLACFLLGACLFVVLMAKVGSYRINPVMVLGSICFIASLLVYRSDVINEDDARERTRVSVHMLYSSSMFGNAEQQREWSSFADSLLGDITIGKFDVDQSLDIAGLPMSLQDAAREAASGKTPIFVFVKEWYRRRVDDLPDYYAKEVARLMTKSEMLKYMRSMSRSSM